MHSSPNWLLLAVFTKTQDLFQITNLVFEISFFCNVLRNVTKSVAFYCKFAIFDDFEENHFFLKTYWFFFQKTKTWTFWENLINQSHSIANLLPLSLIWKIEFFSKKPIHLLKEKTLFESFENFYFFNGLVV